GSGLEALAFATVGTRDLGVVRLLLAPTAFGDWEQRAVSDAVRGFLQSSDRAVRIVVHHEPDDRELVLDRSRERRRVLAESAVADQRNDGAVGTRDLRADRCRRTEAHRCV